VGVPEITPVPVFRLKPVGRAGLMLKVGVPEKLMAEMALDAVSAALTWPLTVWLLGDRLWVATVRLSVAVEVCAPLVAVSVWLVVLCAAVGMPEITPVLVFKLRPAGRAGLML
jgi:hypothetical protein